MLDLNMLTTYPGMNRSENLQNRKIWQQRNVASSRSKTNQYTT